MKSAIVLPLAAAALLGLSACAKSDGAANNAAAADETLTLNEEGVAADNGFDAQDGGNLDAPALDNAALPANGADGNAL